MVILSAFMVPLVQNTHHTQDELLIKIASLRELDGNYTTQTLELNKPVAPSEPGTSL
jgi:hypothetical protein